MKKRLKALFPLFFLMFLTFLPILVIVFSENQRKLMKIERKEILWEQQARNCLQLMKSSATFRAQINKKNLQLKDYVQKQLSENVKIDSNLFSSIIKKHFKQPYKAMYAGLSKKKRIKLFSGKAYSSQIRSMLRIVLQYLLEDDKPTASQESQYTRRIQGLFGQNITLDLMKDIVRGKLFPVNFRGQPSKVLWDYIELSKNEKLVYCLLFPRESITRIDAMENAAKILTKEFNNITMVMVPLEFADKTVKYKFNKKIPNTLEEKFNKLYYKVNKKEFLRDKLILTNKIVNIDGLTIIRSFIDFSLPFEVWAIRDSKLETSINAKSSYFVFIIKLLFGITWTLVPMKIILTGQPLNISQKHRLNLRFFVIGFFPLLVIYASGTIQIDVSTFSREQRMIKNAMQQLEEADTFGESVSSEYVTLCRKIFRSTNTNKILSDWNEQNWKKFSDTLPVIFKKAGLTIDALHILPPPSSKLPRSLFSFENCSVPVAQEDKAGDIYSSWLSKYYVMAIKPTQFGPEIPFFKGRLGREVIRFFFANTGEGDISDLGTQKHLLYTDFVYGPDGMRNAFVVRNSISHLFASYLIKRINDLQTCFKDNTYSLAKKGSQKSEMILPKPMSKEAGLINKHLSDLIKLAQNANVQIINQSSDFAKIVYPCKRSNGYILSALISFKGLRYDALYQETILLVILILLLIPLISLSRIITSYLIVPIKEVEAGLIQISHNDFAVNLNSGRQDELGDLMNSFANMKKGLEERYKLGRFVSASLDQEISNIEILKKEGLSYKYGAVLCSDIRNFTAMSEQYSTREMVLLLNNHLDAMTQCITSNGGFIEQFIGDAIIAAFFADTIEEASKHAILAAKTMQQEQRILAKRRIQNDEFSYEIGIGIDCGNLLSGTIKIGNKKEYMVIGDARIAAEELETLSKKGAMSKIIISKNIKDLIPQIECNKLQYAWELSNNGGIK